MYLHYISVFFLKITNVCSSNSFKSQRNHILLCLLSYSVLLFTFFLLKAKYQNQ